MTNSFPTRRSSDLLDRVLNAGLGEDWLLCINNRNLRTFATSLETTLDLLPRIPPALNVVTESGIAMPADVARMRAASVHRFLRSEEHTSELQALMRISYAVFCLNKTTLNLY